MEHLIIGAFIIIGLVVRGIREAIKAAARPAGKIPGGGVPGSAVAPPAGMSRADTSAMASRLVSPQMGRLPLSSSPSASTPSSGEAPSPGLPRRRPELAATRRRPDAGGPAVTREATTASLYSEEAELEASEPAPLAVPLQSNSSAKLNPALFSDSSNFVRAFILQEVLGPPISRRRHR